MSKAQAINAQFRRDLIDWGDSVGIRLRSVPAANSLAAAFSTEQRSGNLQGVPGWTLEARTRAARIDISEVLRKLEIYREDNGDPFAAALIQYRSPAHAEPGQIRPFVVMDLPGWGRVVNALNNRDD